jgi:hypothetical protein
MAKNQQTITMKLVAEVALDILGPDGLLWGADGVDGGRYAEQFNFVRCMSIAGGSDEINKNVIGERALGLPREPDANKGLSYREVLAAEGVAADSRRRWTCPVQNGRSRAANGGGTWVASTGHLGDGHPDTARLRCLPAGSTRTAPKLISLPDGGRCWLMRACLTYASQNLRGRGKGSSRAELLRKTAAHRRRW